MPKSKTAKNLFSDFPPVSKSEWEKKISEDLDTDNYKKKLTWNTFEGFTAPPFAHSEDMDTLSTGEIISISIKPGWKICQHISETDPENANKSIKEALENGVDILAIKCRATPNVGMLGGDMSGTQIQNQAGFSSLMNGITLKNRGLFFDSGMTTPALLAMLEKSEQKPSSAYFTFDPFTYTANHGRLPVPEPEISQLIQQISGASPWQTLCADALFYRNSGATLVQEVGLALAIVSEFLASVPETDRAKVADSLFVRLSAGPLYFPEIAKFRAIRLLWKTLLEAYELDSHIPLHIHAETTRENKTVTDSYNNLLRLTTEAMAASTGGVDSLLIHPYDDHFKKTGDFSKRISRNIHHILNEESYFSKVSDPASGSYYIEQLTDSIAEQGWSYFQFIEKQGGVLKALKGNFIQESIESSKAGKAEAYAQQKKVLVGTSQYTNSEEELPDSFNNSEFTDSLSLSDDDYAIDKKNLIPSLQNAFNEGAYIGDVVQNFLNPQKVLYPTLTEFRAGLMFDTIRLKTEKNSHGKGDKPLAVIVPIGDNKWRQARANFAKNFLASAGFNIATSLGFESLNEAKNEIVRGAEMYVLCSSDKEYPELIESFCNEFGDSSNLLILAGNPGDNESDYRDAGIDYFIHRDSDMPNILQKIQDQLF